MKTSLPTAAVFAGLFILNIAVAISCKKTDTADLTPKEDLVLGKWNINRVQLRLYTGTTFIKDTIIKQTPKPENFVDFDPAGDFEYRFNTAISDVGAYQFSGVDSLIAGDGGNTHRWKMLTLTKDLFTVVSTSLSEPGFPGYKVEKYQTFVRYK
jgi:hypothetical protein